MAQEIEQYLMAKFQAGLGGKDKGSSKIPMFSQFQEIKTLLEEILRSLAPANQSNVREKLYCLNNLLSECQMLSEKRYIFRSPEDLLTINKIRLKLKQIKKELKEMKGSKMASNGNVSQPNNAASPSGDAHTSKPRSASRSVDAFKVHGFNDDVTTLERLLLRQGSDDGFKAIAIVGANGIGKTTLCQLIFNKPEVKGHFLPRIWVCMSECHDDDDDKKAIIKRMLFSLGVEEKTMNSVWDSRGLEGLLCALYLQLVGKRYLIVFDDARETDSWHEQLNSKLTGDGKWDQKFAYGLPKGCGGTVIVSTRNEEVAKGLVGEKNLYRLLPLSDPESCWAIFKDSVKKDVREFNHSNLEDLKMEVKMKCAGIPLAIKMMGEIMRKQISEGAAGIQTHQP
ncbi:hypothetical protein FNV43_RR07684 [Rhamnella rubrinervis]|uniref:NB-ARC domain-containing protein n=1 Tax=Rhamnella rubrinervis TaxID=2594499 RepID=A0A8K0HH18_9ROSA|nr:hypothetical protein FNV43_RR07684 [Rhamnella rubrinervis]